MSAPHSTVEPAQVKLLHDAIRQLIGMVEGWDMGASIVWPEPLPPLDEYLAQAGALDAQGNRINSPRTHQLIDQHFKLRRQQDAMCGVKPTGINPNEVLPNFKRLCDVAGELAETLGWPRPVTMTVLNDFDRRKVLPAGSQHLLYNNVVVLPPPPGKGPIVLPFTHELWLPWPRQDFPDFPGQFPPTPNPGPPINNELVAHSWAMHNDQGKPRLLDMLRQWERFTADKARDGERQSGAVAEPMRRRKMTGKHLKDKPLTAAQNEALSMLTDCKGNKTEAAKRLGITRTALDHRLDGLKLRGELSKNRSVEAKRLPTDRRGQPAV